MQQLECPFRLEPRVRGRRALGAWGRTAAPSLRSLQVLDPFIQQATARGSLCTGLRGGRGSLSVPPLVVVQYPFAHIYAFVLYLFGSQVSLYFCYWGLCSHSFTNT